MLLQTLLQLLNVTAYFVSTYKCSINQSIYRFPDLSVNEVQWHRSGEGRNVKVCSMREIPLGLLCVILDVDFLRY